MKVKEYLVNRLVEVERDLENSKKNYELLMKEVKAFSDKCDKLEDEIDQYQMEREHIREIITCNTSDDEIKLVYPQCDYTTLLAILDIKPEDYTECTQNKTQDKTQIINCIGCRHVDQPDYVYPCCVCNNGDRYNRTEVIPDAETTD